MRHSRPIIIIHGGAGDWPSELHKRGLNGVRKAADRGFRILSSGGSALDAVQVSIVSLEDDPVFNAGRGSTLNLRGEIETDAAIMDGKTLCGAGVALLRDIKNPIKAARIVFEKTDHALIAGAAARELALANGLAKMNLRVSSRVKVWKEGLRKLESKRVSFFSRTTRRSFSTFFPSPLILSVLSVLIVMGIWLRPAPLAESRLNFPEGSETARFLAPVSTRIIVREQRPLPGSESKQ
jgi:isoaspartyl peptidase/L-asparaginase-like protein (Ntn-hydrolase superfamily)